jgi:hypothetical protein
MSDNNIDQVINNIAKDQNASCKHFTVHSMLNHSSNYQYANTADVNHCSNPIFISSQNPIPLCPFYPVNSACAVYEPDISILQTCLSDNVTLFLSKLRSFDGSYVYVIHSDTGSVYNKYTYTDLDAKTNDLDSEAIRLFNLNILEFQLNNSSVQLDVPNVSEEPKNSSYLSSLLS